MIIPFGVDRWHWRIHRHNTSLQELQLIGNRIGDAGAAAIAERLRCANLYSCLCGRCCSLERSSGVFLGAHLAHNMLESDLSVFCGVSLVLLASSFLCFAIQGHSIRHNSTLRNLDLSNNPISAPVRKSVYLEVVLCQLRNVQVTRIDASYREFDDADATRIAEALRCEFMCMCWCGRMSSLL